MNSHTLTMKIHWIVPITAMSQDVCVLDCSLKVSVPQPQNVWKKLMWKLFFPNVSRDYAETSPWFVHVTYCYCSGKRNLNKFFSNYKTAFCSKLAHIDGATLNNFGCVYLIETHAQWTGCFLNWKREAVVV